MRGYVQLVEKFVIDLEKEGFLDHYTVNDNIYRFHLQKHVLFLYLPETTRLQDDFERRTVHLDIDLLASSYTKVLNRIRGLMGKGARIYARDTVVSRIDKKVALSFLEEYHMNVPLAGKYRYGIFERGELVSVAVFSGGRIMREVSEEYRSFELLRFCHKADCLVVGGISKLIKTFIKDFSPNDIMTYADKDWSQQSSLESIGFKEVGSIEEQVFYIRDGNRIVQYQEGQAYDYKVKNKGSIKLKLYL